MHQVCQLLLGDGFKGGEELIFYMLLSISKMDGASWRGVAGHGVSVPCSLARNGSGQFANSAKSCTPSSETSSRE